MLYLIRTISGTPKIMMVLKNTKGKQKTEDIDLLLTQA